MNVDGTVEIDVPNIYARGVRVYSEGGISRKGTRSCRGRGHLFIATTSDPLGAPLLLLQARHYDEVGDTDRKCAEAASRDAHPRLTQAG